jgi:hypothetical protein
MVEMDSFGPSRVPDLNYLCLESSEVPSLWNTRSTVACPSSINGEDLLRSPELGSLQTLTILDQVQLLCAIHQGPHRPYSRKVPHGGILEADMWPNQVGDTCHVLTGIINIRRVHNSLTCGTHLVCPCHLR